MLLLLFSIELVYYSQTKSEITFHLDEITESRQLIRHRRTFLVFSFY